VLGLLYSTSYFITSAIGYAALMNSANYGSRDASKPNWLNGGRKFDFPDPPSRLIRRAEASRCARLPYITRLGRNPGFTRRLQLLHAPRCLVNGISYLLNERQKREIQPCSPDNQQFTLTYNQGLNYSKVGGGSLHFSVPFPPLFPSIPSPPRSLRSPPLPSFPPLRSRPTWDSNNIRPRMYSNSICIFK